MKQAYTYECTQIIPCTQDISIFLLHPQEQPLIFQPGQYVQAWVDEDNKLLLSIANIPQEGHLEFHLRHDQHHPYAQKLMARLLQEKKIYLQGPQGQMTLNQANQARRIFFLAGGTGFAPIKSLLKEALRRPEFANIPLHLYWGVRRPEEAFDEPLLQTWQTAFAQFQYEIVLSEHEHYPQWQKGRGLVPHYLAQQQTDFSDSIIFASGPFPMIQAAKTLFYQQGLSHHALISDMITPI